MVFQLNEMLAQEAELAKGETNPDTGGETTGVSGERTVNVSGETTSERPGSTNTKQNCTNCSCDKSCLSDKVEKLQLDRRKIDPALFDF
jgi:hypothetical protein